MRDSRYYEDTTVNMLPREPREPLPEPDPDPVPDTTPPSLTITAPANGAVVELKGSSTTVKVTGSASDSYSGMAGINGSRDGAAFGINGTFGAWEADVPIPGIGPHNITISCSDNAGNRTVRTVTVTAVDNSPPVLEVTQPEPRYATEKLEVGDVAMGIAGRAGDPESGVEYVRYNLDGGGYGPPDQRSGESWSGSVKLPAFVPPGGREHTVTVIARNRAGKDAPPQVRKLLAKDKTAPQVRIVEPATKTYEVAGSLDGAEVTVKGTASDTHDPAKLYSGIRSVQWRLNDGAYTDVDPVVPGDWSKGWSKRVRVPARGTHRISVLCTDNAGNPAADYVDVTVMLPYESKDPKDPLSTLAYLGDLLDFAEKRVKVGTPKNGLKGEYYDNKDLTDLRFTRVDDRVDFVWAASPPPLLQLDTFSVRWTGLVKPRLSGTYTFYADADDGVRLWVNKKLIIDAWRDQAAEIPSTPIELHADGLYELKLEYYENLGAERVRLLWSSSSGQAKEVVPRDRLFFLEPVDRKSMTRAFHQRFGSLTSFPYKGSNTRPIRQVRLCAEVLRKLLATRPADTVAHWAFDEGAGDRALDSSGNGNAATLRSPGGPAWQAGKVGSGCLSFDGADDVVGIAAGESLRGTTNDFTVAFWAEPRSTHEIDAEGISGTSGTSGQRYAIGPEHGASAYGSPDHAGVGVSVGTNGVSVYEHSDNYLPAVLVHAATLSGWTHVAVVYEGGRPRLYVNGTLAKTGQKGPKKYVHANPQGIGAWGNNRFHGLLDDVRVYDRPLSAAEVSGLVAAQGDVAWMDDATPPGATLVPDADGWNWVTANPAPFSGARAHQSAVLAGTHQHFFHGASEKLQVEPGDRLFAYLYLDPANPPSEVMLQWDAGANGGGWEHRAYWGADQISSWGTNGTASRRYMGPLPPAGRWVRLEVPAGQVGLEGRSVTGMAFALHNGRATWDRAGKTAHEPDAPHLKALARAEAGYRQTAYGTLLNRLGTSYEELRLARTADAGTREALARRLGIDRLAAGRPDGLDRLFLPPDGITEPFLERLFGLKGTADGSPGDGPDPDLLSWRLASLRASWRVQDHADEPGKAPIVDPDLIGPEDLQNPIAGNLAYDRWKERRGWVDGWLRQVREQRERHAVPIAGFDAVVAGWVGPVGELVALEERRKKGENVERELKERRLSLPAFSYLMRLRDLATAGTMLPDEWDGLYSVLVQVKKLSEYANWRKAEKESGLALEPGYFKVPAPDPAIFPPPQPRLPAWRATALARREWQKTLQGRLDQQEAVVQDLRAAVDAAEEIALPLLRDALVAAIDTAHPGSGSSDRLTRRLQIDVRDSGYRKTTRIDQAVETIQGVLFSLRTGQFDEAAGRPAADRISDWTLDVNASYGESDFDDEWRWMGSYDSWRAAMLVFLYPENLLLPTLRDARDMITLPGAQGEERPFEKMVEALRGGYTLSPQKAREAAKAYLDDLRGADPNSPLAALLYELDELSEGYTGGPFELTDQLSEAELSSRGKVVRDAFANRGVINPHDAPEALKEILYFAPMQLALQLQQSGQHLAALDWFQTVYAYNLPAAERKVYRGLELEKDVETDYRRPVEWLLDYMKAGGATRWRSNPHENARFRRHAYTRFTLLSLARCFLEFADAEFTRDTAESLPRARALYANALDLLGLPEMQPDGNSLFPPNPVPRTLRQRAELNLSKLRGGRNIAGMQRQVEPVAPRPMTDGMPAARNGQLVVPGAAASPRPTPYYYSVLVERARQLVALAQQVEVAYLSALEKRDEEDYRFLQAGHDLDLARASVKLQDLRVGEAASGVTLAERQRERAGLQAEHYGRLLERGISGLEIASLAQMGVAAGLQLASAVTSLVASALPASISASANIFPPGASLSVSASPQGSALAVAGALSSGAAAASTTASITSALASYERRREEWGLQKSIAEKDVYIGDQQVVLAQYQSLIVGQERVVAGMQTDHAKAVADFLANKFTNAELYNWMSGVLGGVYGYFLQQATAVALLAQDQLAFERQETPPSFVKADYWQPPSGAGGNGSSDGEAPDRRGLTGSARLLQDVHQLDQYAFETNRRKLQLSQTFSLAQMDPFGFQRFRETGSLIFATPMELFDRAFPGHYLRLIRRVRASVIALVPSTQGVRATLSASGISRAVVGGDEFQTVVIRRNPELIAFTVPNNATGLFELDPQSEMMLPFEGMGVDTSWELEMPRAANPFDYRTIADVLFTVEYTAFHDYGYRQQVIQSLDSDLTADAQFSLGEQFPDQWYELTNNDEAIPASVEFSTTRDDFPPNVEVEKIERLMLYFAVGDGATSRIKVRNIRLNGSTTGGLTSEGGVITTRALSGEPFGEWELTFDDEGTKALFREGRIEDILFVVTYSGRTPEWPT